MCEDVVFPGHDMCVVLGPGAGAFFGSLHELSPVCTEFPQNKGIALPAGMNSWKIQVQSPPFSPGHPSRLAAVPSLGFFCQLQSLFPPFLPHFVLFAGKGRGVVGFQMHTQLDFAG